MKNTNIKRSIEEVRQIIGKEGYKLLSDVYVNNKEKLVLLCPSNHEYRVNLTSFTTKSARCPICQGKTPHTTVSVRDILSKKGNFLITGTYENMHQKLEILCSNGHTYSTSLDSYMRRELGCSKCRGVHRLNLEEVKEILRNEGYTLLSDEYLNNSQKLNIVCPQGHPTTTTISSFVGRKSRCKYCVPHPEYTLESVRTYVEKEEYALISIEYGGAHSKLELLCPKKHKYVVSFSNFKNCNSRCTKCTMKGTSKGEIALTNGIKVLYPSAKKKRFYYDPNNIRRFWELDIFIPELMKGIEFDGTFTHSYEYMRKGKKAELWSDDDVRNYHDLKDTYFYSIGIKVLHIKQADWDLNPEACIKRCLDFLAS